MSILGIAVISVVTLILSIWLHFKKKPGEAWKSVLSVFLMVPFVVFTSPFWSVGVLQVGQYSFGRAGNTEVMQDLGDKITEVISGVKASADEVAAAAEAEANSVKATPVATRTPLQVPATDAPTATLSASAVTEGAPSAEATFAATPTLQPAVVVDYTVNEELVAGLKKSGDTDTLFSYCYEGPRKDDPICASALLEANYLVEFLKMSEHRFETLTEIPQCENWKVLDVNGGARSAKYETWTINCTNGWLKDFTLVNVSGEVLEEAKAHKVGKTFSTP
jgi:hypothetical protein